MPPVAAESAAPAESAADAVFEAILAGIVRGDYPPRSRLPAERDLARQLGASRPTLREALGRLAEWNLVEARRGSGVVVRDRSDWSIEVLPAFLRYGGGSVPPRELVQMIDDLLALRRALVVEVVALVAPRVDAARLAAARDAAERAWRARDDAAAFARDDFALIRAIVDAAGFLPGVWLINRLAGVYLDLARTITGAAPPPDDYLDTATSLIDALARGDATGAVAIERAYLERHDARLLARIRGDSR
ncbi:MAG: FadR family transcriptional regulator [Deltaproteobacteria bacterium]|nr:MAG: FadR family transcriptional regulator [Deltaproteobacteria bacterium]